MNAPETLEGWQAWQVVRDCGAQLRLAGTRVLGLDYAALFAFADAIGASRPLLAEILPDLEAVIVGRINETLRSTGDG